MGRGLWQKGHCNGGNLLMTELDLTEFAEQKCPLCNNSLANEEYTKAVQELEKKTGIKS